MTQETATHIPGSRIVVGGEVFTLPTMLAADFLAEDDDDTLARMMVMLRGAAELYRHLCSHTTRNGGAMYVRDLQADERTAVVAADDAHYLAERARAGSCPACTGPETAVPRLDYSKPPPGYEVGNAEDEAGERLVVRFGSPGVAGFDPSRLVPWGWNCRESFEASSCGDASSEGGALAAAWSHYKGEHDPLGVEVCSVDDEGFFWVLAADGTSRTPSCDSKEEARAAAWAWHDERLGLVDSLDRIAREARAVGHECIIEGALTWPAALMLSADDVGEVRSYLDSDGRLLMPAVLRAARAVEMPEVLRG